MSSQYQIIVKKDEEVRGTINSFIQQIGWKNAYISGAIGSIYDAKYVMPSGAVYPPPLDIIAVAMPGEILSFTGEILPIEQVPPHLLPVYNIKENFFAHIHASAAAGGHVYGGGLLGAKAFRSVNIFIQSTFPIYK
ncbi:MAG: DNA-binding protein [Endomicrobium sp.]|jgi:predicted DNA-binding protein with PD1-like motif|nr:DNA-binding protein [Endomicrobium sp.]